MPVTIPVLPEQVEPSPAPFSPATLAPFYNLEEQEDWRLVGQHLAITDGFSFIVVTAPDEWGIALLRERVVDLLPTSGQLQRIDFNPNADSAELAKQLLNLPLSSGARLLWVDADPFPPEKYLARNAAWRNALALLNRYRNTLQEKLTCTVALAVPSSLLMTVREAAPDLWSIRSGVFRIEPLGLKRWLPTEEKTIEDGAGHEQLGDPDLTLTEAEKLLDQPGRELFRADLLRRAGIQAAARFQWDKAERCLTEAFTLLEVHGSDPEIRTGVANELTILFSDRGDFELAFHYARLALEIAERSFGPDNPRTAAALSNYAELLRETNQLKESESLMRRALEIDERILGPEHPSVATELSNLGLLMRSTNRLSEAERLLRRALAIDELNFGDKHSKIAVDLNNLALVLSEERKTQESESLMRRALGISERLFGPNHPRVAAHLNNLAQLLQATNRLEEAEALMRRAIAIDHLAYGSDHPKVALEVSNLAWLLKETGRISEAEPLMRRALQTQENVWGQSSPQVANGLNNLALLLQDAGRVDEAESVICRSLSILVDFSRKTGYPHFKFNDSVQNYVEILRERGHSAQEIEGKLAEIGIRALPKAPYPGHSIVPDDLRLR